MTKPYTFSFSRLGSNDELTMRQLNEVFARAFNEPETYAKKPSKQYVDSLLSKSHMIVMAASNGNQIVGGLVAYVLEKLEQERSEVYLYDLAVDEPFRRQGIARGLIEALKNEAKKIGAWVIFVQADKIDEPAVKLYQSLGEQEEPYHFDILVK